MKFTIYCIKNKLNNKNYIGYTSKTIEKRFQTHIKNAKKKVNRRLYDSMNHHGYENFEITEIDFCYDKTKAEELESWYVYLYDSKNPDNGYNMTWGGDGGNTMLEWSEEQKKILYQKQKEKREKTFLEKYGVTSPTKLDWVREKLSKIHKGKTLDINHKNKISNTIKNKIKSNQYSPNTSGLRPHIKGEYKHSDETKKKLSEFREGKKYEDIFDRDVAINLKKERQMAFSGSSNPLYVENLNNDQQQEFIKLLINGSTMSECSNYFNKSEYKLRQLLRKFGIKNIQKLKREDSNNTLLNKIIKSL